MAGSSYAADPPLPHMENAGRPWQRASVPVRRQAAFGCLAPVSRRTAPISIAADGPAAGSWRSPLPFCPGADRKRWVLVRPRDALVGVPRARATGTMARAVRDYGVSAGKATRSRGAKREGERERGFTDKARATTTENHSQEPCRWGISDGNCIAWLGRSKRPGHGEPEARPNRRASSACRGRRHAKGRQAGMGNWDS